MKLIAALRASHVAASLLALAVSSVLLTGCNDLPKPRGSGVEIVTPARSGALNALDVAIAPVVNDTTRVVPASALRAGLQKALVKRRYSPLAIEYVDSKVVDAAYRPGAAGEQATLVLTVEGWDDARWSSHNALQVTLLARIVPGDGSKVDLWAARMTRKFEDPNLLDSFATDSGRMAYVCELMTRELLENLEARSPSSEAPPPASGM